MQLQIKPSDKSAYPFFGCFIKGSSVQVWLSELELMLASLSGINVYPLPSKIPNQLWGCLVEIPPTKMPADFGLYQKAHVVMGRLIIPEQAEIFPKTTETELQQIFKKGNTIMHPDIGTFELDGAIRWEDLISPSSEREVAISIPENSVFIPSRLRAIQIKEVPPEEILSQFEKDHVPKPEKLKNEPLNLFEKGKLLFYQTLFNEKDSGKEQAKDANTTDNGAKGKTSPLGGGLKASLAAAAALIGKQAGVENAFDNMARDYENLHERNQKEIDRLLKLMQDNPEEALKYALPLDGDGTSRGGANAGYKMGKMRDDFALFGNRKNAEAGGGVDVGEDYFRLRKQYEATAKALIQKGDYQKAAFVFMKLLKNYSSAAQTLEKGQFYRDAAAIYEKYVGDCVKAAECYEKAHMYQKAISLYNDQKLYEKAADLYMKTGDEKEAKVYYQKAIEKHQSNNQYVKAADIYSLKMNDLPSAQKLLLDGWINQKHASQCLGKLLENAPDEANMLADIEMIYSKHVVKSNQMTFLSHLSTIYRKAQDSGSRIREIAYEIVADEAKTYPDAVSQLLAFNLKDAEFRKDVGRYKLSRRR